MSKEVLLPQLFLPSTGAHITGSRFWKLRVVVTVRENGKFQFCCKVIGVVAVPFKSLRFNDTGQEMTEQACRLRLDVLLL